MAGDMKNSEATVTTAVLDDDPRIGTTVAAYLRRMGCEVSVFTDPGDCLKQLAKNPVDIVVTDLRMPEIDGIQVLERVKGDSPSTDVIIVTGSGDKEDAVQALRLGAFDFFEKPVDGIELVETIKRTVRYRNVVRERDRLAEQVSSLSRREAKKWGIEAFVGVSKAIRKVVRDIQLVQRSTGTSVLITGESGTGKELVARAIHFGGPRSDKPFVPVNCSAVPADLAESTLFGHVRGAFTGATSDRKGSFDLADGGTLFLDEIGDMPMVMQAKLLRVLEDGVVDPVGGTRGHRVDVRVIAATNADLEEKIGSRAFRSDLYYRLAGYAIALPPLRARREDIPVLAEHFANVLSREMGFPEQALSPAVLQQLQAHAYPGNARELRNVMERGLIQSAGGGMKEAHVHFSGPSATEPREITTAAARETPGLSDLPLNLRRAETILIRKAMATSDGNVSAAARLLGINRAKLYRKLAALDADAATP